MKIGQIRYTLSTDGHVIIETYNVADENSTVPNWTEVATITDPKIVASLTQTLDLKPEVSREEEG